MAGAPENGVIAKVSVVFGESTYARKYCAWPAATRSHTLRGTSPSPSLRGATHYFRENLQVYWGREGSFIQRAVS